MTPRETKLEAALDANAALRVQAERPQAPSHDADAFMADILAKRLVERARYVVMKCPPLGGHSPLGRGFEH